MGARHRLAAEQSLAVWEPSAATCSTRWPLPRACPRCGSVVPWPKSD